MSVLNQEGKLAAGRVELHWKQVREKQRRCEQLQIQLQQLRRDLGSLLSEERCAHQAFNVALQHLCNEKALKQSQYNHTIPHHSKTMPKHKYISSTPFIISPTLLTQSSGDQLAYVAMKEARDKYNSMCQEQHNTTGASSSQGKALQAAKRAVEAKQREISAAESSLRSAMIPPTPLIQPLPDSRESNYEALAALFYIRCDLADNMPLLQQICCAAQLAACPWPLLDGKLWDIRACMESPELGCCTWNEHFRNRASSCPYLPSVPTVASLDVRADVHAFAKFQEPVTSEVCSHVLAAHCFCC
jgi:hypothetical protein